MKDIAMPQSNLDVIGVIYGKNYYREHQCVPIL